MNNIKSYLFNRHPQFAEDSATPIHIADVNGRHYYAFTKELTPPSGGKHVTEDEIDAICKHSLLLQQVKREAKRRIDDMAPLWKQCNALADLMLLQHKDSLTNEEQERLNSARQLFEDINALRTRSNDMASQLLSGIKVDYITDASWKSEQSNAQENADDDSENINATSNINDEE